MKILQICWTTFGNKIKYWKKWPSRLRVKDLLRWLWRKGTIAILPVKQSWAGGYVLIDHGNPLRNDDINTTNWTKTMSYSINIPYTHYTQSLSCCADCGLLTPYDIIELLVRGRRQANTWINDYIFIHEKTFEKVVCDMVTIFFQPRCVNIRNL